MGKHLSDVVVQRIEAWAKEKGATKSHTHKQIKHHKPPHATIHNTHINLKQASKPEMGAKEARMSWDSRGGRPSYTTQPPP